MYKLFSKFPAVFTPIIGISLLLLPIDAQAEAFKGGFFSSGQEKALFFILLLLGLAVVVGGFFILVGIWEWLNTGKKDKLKKYLAPSIAAIAILLVLGFFLLLVML